ncbi:uncharacterized protein LOC131231610 isoform X7 [Magnolia sinica]|uniref:uncharacterized protein LOC131231610 isoform X7 n=1 Tax=Magnolia sinica TaxID=86752 RepID=UPI00265AE53F|nr:uncharacterized protein LOC131231610 isoform X7 [Magnolia sinica]
MVQVMHRLKIRAMISPRKTITSDMSYSREGRNTSRSPSHSPQRRSRSRSLSRSRVRSRSRSRESGDAINPGNNLYVTGLSTRVTDSDLEKYFSSEGKVVECHLVMDPRTRESRGFGFVTMETVQDADRCVKYLNRSVLEGRLITVQKVVGGDSRLASHPGGGKEAPLIRGVGGNDPALRMGGGMSIPTHTGDTGSVHCQLAAKDDTSHEALQSSQPTFSLAFLCITSDCGCGFTPKGMPFSFQTPNWIQTGILSTWVWTSMFEIACHVIATPKLAYESMFESIIFIACLVGID